MFSIAESLPAVLETLQPSILVNDLSSLLPHQISQIMAQKLEATTPTTSGVTNQYNIANEIELAYTTLKSATKNERVARELLESLFKKRKEDALEGVKRARQHLDFVNEEEARMREGVSDENASTEKAPDAVGDDKKGTRTPDQHKVRQDFPQGLIQESRHKKVEPSAKKVPSQPQSERSLVSDLVVVALVALLFVLWLFWEELSSIWTIKELAPHRRTPNRGCARHGGADLGSICWF